MKCRVLLLLTGLLSAMFNGHLANATADDDWGDENWTEQTTSPWLYGGFVEAAYGGFLQANIIDSNASLAELRGRFELTYSPSHFEFSAKGDLLFDEVLGKTLWSTREFNISASPLDNVDIKLGRQVLTWGTGDYLFLNDLFAKDWQAFFNGRDDAYLKAPADSVRVTTYVGNLTLDLAWTPSFTPDNYLTGERFSFYSPQQGQLVAPAQNFAVNKTTDDQWSMRLATTNNSIEYALYGYRGFWTTPQGADNTGLAYFPKLTAWGASVRMPLATGLFNAEFAQYDSKEDNQGTNPAIANSQLRFVVGFEKEVAKNLTAASQYYVEKTHDYAALQANSAQPSKIVEQYRQLLTLRLRYALWQQKLVYSLFAFYSPTDHDSYIRPTINYRQDDHWSFWLGANLFGGKNEFSFFGQHQDNSNAWLRLRYQF